MKQRVSISVVIEPCSKEDDEREYRAHAVATKPGVGYEQGGVERMTGYTPAGIEAVRRALQALQDRDDDK